MEMPVGDFLDRFAILTIKFMNLRDEVKEEYDVFNQEFHRLCSKHPEWRLADKLQELISINEEIWSYEADLRKGQLGKYNSDELGNFSDNELKNLAAVGIAAIRIRNVNRCRKRAINALVELTGTGFKDVKVNHASEEVKLPSSVSA